MKQTELGDKITAVIGAARLDGKKATHVTIHFDSAAPAVKDKKGMATRVVPGWIVDLDVKDARSISDIVDSIIEDNMLNMLGGWSMGYEQIALQYGNQRQQQQLGGFGGQQGWQQNGGFGGQQQVWKRMSIN